MTRRDIIIRELNGLRLALYDEALAAGPRGLSESELRMATLEDAQRMGLLPKAHDEAMRWLLEYRLLHEYQAGRYRARPKEFVLEEPMAPEAPKPAVAQLRTPLFAPRARRDGQGTFF